MKRVLTILVTTLVALSQPQAALACGGMLQVREGTVSQSGQLAILSVHDGVTDVTLTLDVPSADNAFGVLVPVSGKPDIDREPVSTEALSALEASTRPTFAQPSNAKSESSSGCSDSKSAPKEVDTWRRGVVVSEPVQIGPVTAVWLSGTSGASVSAWLTEHDFVLPANAAETLDAYTTAGMSFLAFTRSSQSSGAARVGVRFTLTGDRRAYALRMTRLGAGAEMTFTVFVATSSPKPVGPALPYAALAAHNIFNGSDGDASDYAGAVRTAVAGAGGKAFVLETFGTPAELPRDAAALFPTDAFITRLSTIVQTSDLDSDVAFTATPSLDVQRVGALASLGASSSARASFDPLTASLLAWFALGQRRRRQR